MIYLHKYLPVLFLPFGLSMLLLLAGLLLRRRILLIAGVAVLFIFSIPLTSQFLMRSMEGTFHPMSPDKMPEADAIVVLSNSGLIEEEKTGTIEWGDPDRFLGGVRLYYSGKAPLLVFTGGWLPWNATARTEGEILVGQARLLGIPAEAMCSTEKASNTEQESAATARTLLERRGKSGDARPSQILLVTSAYHMPRARRLFEKAGMGVTPFPVDFKAPPFQGISLMDFLPDAGALEMSETALRELYGRWYYQLKP